MLRFMDEGTLLKLVQAAAKAHGIQDVFGDEIENFWIITVFWNAQ